jgi:hypothetical protein
MSPASGRPSIGWREWVSLPELGIANVKVKVDTGARSSSLHAFDVTTFDRDGKQIVQFKVHPFQRDASRSVTATAPLMEYRRVRSSSGHATLRPVILTSVEWAGRRWTIELTLASRDQMGFRMLLGRAAVRERFVVDPGRSYLGGKPMTRRRSGKKAKKGSRE